eukprot:5011475-Amphidinium_carterae.1
MASLFEPQDIDKIVKHVMHCTERWKDTAGVHENHLIHRQNMEVTGACEEEQQQQQEANRSQNPEG